jgi:MGT family glycosyltransferase
VTPPSVLFFSMGEPGHFNRLRPLIAGLVRAGVPVNVFTHAGFRAAVESDGAAFSDLFAAGPLEDADDESMPVPCRFVTFAAERAEEVARRAAALEPALVVHDTFAVIGRVVARGLGLPHVNVCAGHAVVPERFLAELARDPRVRVAPRCHAAVEALRSRHGIADASPFSYVSSTSRDLNVYCEPPQFLLPADRAALEPLAFCGSLPDDASSTGGDDAAADPFPRGAAGGDVRRVYVSFGTVVWRYYAAQALAALEALTEFLAGEPRVRALISLGGAEVGPAAEGLRRPNVEVVSRADQWRVLQRADLFVTHHGLNSTHEAIFHAVPMLSYPFFWDQPALAERCREMGLAVPLANGPRAPLDAATVAAAFARAEARREAMARALAVAAGWEREVMAGRPALIRRLLGLMADPPREGPADGGSSPTGWRAARRARGAGSRRRATARP